MHEFSIASSIVSIVATELEKGNVKSPVERIRFLAGTMHAILPDSLRFHFDIVKRDHPLMKGAELEIVEIPVKIRCKNCGHEEAIREPLFLCPQCGGAVTVIAGEEMRVESIDVSDEEQGTVN